MDMKGLSFWPDPRAIAVFKDFLIVSQKLDLFKKKFCLLFVKFTEVTRKDLVLEFFS